LYGENTGVGELRRAGVVAADRIADYIDGQYDQQAGADPGTASENGSGREQAGGMKEELF
jgi:hypothetical protein